MFDILGLTPGEFALLTAIFCVAGLVRGFAGFALSALVMASAVSILSPVELIPLLWYAELAASLLMGRAGWRDADRTVALLLVAGAWVGWPIGLWLTTYLPVEQSKLVALAVILTLAALQLARIRIPGLETRAGTLVAGVASGTVSGIANVGGMVVALYVLAQNSAARSMRGTLVIYLFLGSLGALVTQLSYGVMDATATFRGLAFVPITLLSVWAGSKLFNPRWEPYYRPFCLGLLMMLAGAGLLRTVLT